MMHQNNNSHSADTSITGLVRNLFDKCKKLFLPRTKVEPEHLIQILAQSPVFTIQSIDRSLTHISNRNQHIILQDLNSEQEFSLEANASTTYIDRELGRLQHLQLEDADQIHSTCLGVLQYQPPEELQSLEDAEDESLKIVTIRPRSPQATYNGGTSQQSRYSSSNYFSWISVPNNLKNHIDMMFFMGLSPVRGNGKLGSRLHMVRFVLTTTSGLFDALGDFKEYIMENATTGDMFHYVTIWHSICLILLQLYIFKMFTINYQSTTSILIGPSNSNLELQPSRQRQLKVYTRSVLYACAVVIMAFAAAIRVDWMINGHSMKVVLLSRSHLVSSHIFNWEKGNINGNQTEELAGRFGTELSTATFMMGIFGYFSVFAGNMQKDFTRDILLMIALDVHNMSQHFKSYAVEQLGGERQIAEVLSDLREMHSNFAEKSSKIDHVFGSFLIFLHVDNLLFCSYFLLDMLQAETESIYFAESLIFIPKILCAYYISARIIKLVKDVESSLVEAFDKSTLPASEISRVNLFLRKLTTHPIGVGSGEFLLDETFGLKFVGVVISCFLFIADSAKEQSRS